MVSHRKNNALTGEQNSIFHTNQKYYKYYGIINNNSYKFSGQLTYPLPHLRNAVAISPKVKMFHLTPF